MSTATALRTEESVLGMQPISHDVVAEELGQLPRTFTESYAREGGQIS